MKGEKMIWKTVYSVLFIMIILPGSVAAESGFTQQDRELLIELRVRMLEIDKRFEQIDKRFEQVDQRFGMLMNFLYILSGIFTTLVIFVIAFAYWDRRTIIKKAAEEAVREMEKTSDTKNIVDMLRKYAGINSDFARVMRECNLL